MNIYAPVLIPTLNRDIHFKRCVESLVKCTHAEKTDLFIALDYPLKEAHWYGYEKINKYVENIYGFKSVNVIRRDFNFGVRKNIDNVRSLIFENYDRIILTEDDNEFSPNFLDYINKGLDKFEKDPNVFSICAYNFPINVENIFFEHEYYIWKGFSAWGYGTWKNKWENIEFTENYVLNILNNTKAVINLYRYADHYFPNAVRILLSGDITNDTIISMYLIENNMYSVFPRKTKVRNFGHDGTGIHKSRYTTDLYKNQEIDEKITFNFGESVVRENSEISNGLKIHFETSYKNKVYYFFRFFIFNIIYR